MDQIDELVRYWDQHALSDPMWAVLSDPSKVGRRWELNQFFETGRREVSLLMFQLDALRLRPNRDRACDFGCGMGRLTQALVPYFDRIIGVDVSGAMVRLASRLNRYADRVAYVQNRAADLRLFLDGQFDFLYSDIVLQHMDPELSRQYLREFMRIVRVKGVIVFQLPSHKRTPSDLPPQRHPLPNDAYRARLRLVTSVPEPLRAGQQITLFVEIQNVSAVTWPEDASIRLGNHWRSIKTGEMLIQDDGRTEVPRMESNQICVLPLTVTPPPLHDTVACELDLVQEGITWFADRHSQSISVYLQLETSGPSQRAQREHLDTESRDPEYGSAEELYRNLPAPTDSQPKGFPMYGIPRGDVEALIRDNGGALRHREIDERCGREWIGYRYFVQRIDAGST